MEKTHKSVFRVRPKEEHTLDELRNHYLWFSCRQGFKDIDDANIGTFIDHNETLHKALQRHFTPEGIEELKRKMDYTGICCFTRQKPSFKERENFPRYKGSICIEYNRDVLEEYFLTSKYALKNCFNEVLYFATPTVFKEDDEYHILSSSTADGNLYKSIFSLTSDVRGMDELMRLLLTRINSKFALQDELRILLGGRNIQDNPRDKGYQVPIPSEAIVAIHTYKDTPDEFLQRLKEIGYKIYGN